MNQDEELVFDKILDALDLPEPDSSTKEKIIKAVFFLLIAKEIGAFQFAIPGILLDDLTTE